MQKFDFTFGTVLGELILGHSDNLSRIIQAKSTSAAEAQKISQLVITTIKKVFVKMKGLIYSGQSC